MRSRQESRHHFCSHRCVLLHLSAFCVTVYKEPKGKGKGTNASGKAKDEKNEMLHDGQPVAWKWEAIREQSQREEELEEQERNMNPKTTTQMMKYTQTVTMMTEVMS